MSTVFSINFRREAYLREQQKTRRRAFSLGLWVLYFGALAVVLGLYGLNFASLARRVRVVERQVQRLREHPAGDAWRPGRTEATEIERHLEDLRTWRDRLARLPQVLPPNARVRQLLFNPENVSGSSDVRLVIAGELRGGVGQDRVPQVMNIVNSLSRDSVFHASYPNIRLVSTRASSDGTAAEFTIECRR